MADSKCRADSADKSAALASYAKQSGDKTLEHAAMKIRARAIRRCGELLKEVEAKHTGRIRDGAAPNSDTRKQAAEDAGMTPRQAKDAIRVANLHRDDFEMQVESANPPTITALAQQGRKPANRVPQYREARDDPAAVPRMHLLSRRQDKANARVRFWPAFPALLSIRRQDR